MVSTRLLACMLDNTAGERAGAGCAAASPATIAGSGGTREATAASRLAHGPWRIFFMALVATALALVTCGAGIPRAASADDVQAIAAGDTVQGLTPSGTTVDLFDYWTLSQDETTPRSNDQETLSSGINAQSDYLKFVGASYGPEQQGSNSSINGWTGGHLGPKLGMVAPTLDDNGFPTLNAGLRYDGDAQHLTESQSLDYLFDNSTFDGKAEYAGVGGLFQLDENGNYYYDSTRNYAEYDSSTNRFNLYADGRVGSSGVFDSVNGQFFPFNSYDSVADAGSYSEGLNHHFGMHMSSEFMQPAGGKVANGNSMVFNFSGDDDVWIYIDGVLVGDAGGLHDRVTVSIDFATGRVRVGDGNTSGSQWAGVETTLRQLFADAGRDTSGFNGDTFADNGYHRLDFFYLERGSGNSNLKLMTNLMQSPATEAYKLDQQGEPVADATLDIYPADASYAVTGPVAASATTGADGVVTFVDGNNNVVTASQLYNQYGTTHWVIREEQAPAGYRKAPDIHIEFDPATGVLWCVNPYETGSFANARETLSASSGYTTADGVDIPTDGSGKPTSGRLVAVAMKYAGEDGGQNMYGDGDASWYAISRGTEGAWTLSGAPGAAGITDAGAHEFSLTPNGYTVTLDEMPGDIRDYYWVKKHSGNQDTSRYTVAVYWVDDSGTYHLVNSDGFSRTFAARFYVNDTKNRLIVQKVDDTPEKNPVNGATFRLFTDPEATVPAAYEATNNGVTSTLTKQETGVIDYDGAVLFTGLTPGTYYLKETEAPDGYAPNPTVTKVVVTEEGVYADAGTADDDVSVTSGVGTLVATMKQVGVAEGINVTLHNVNGVLSTLPSGEDPSAATGWTEKARHTYHYVGADAAVEFEEDDGDTSPDDRWVDEGWSRLDLTQNLDGLLRDYPDARATYQYTDLGDASVNGSFARSTVVRVADKSAADLSISKQVKGYDGISAEDLKRLQETDFTFALAFKASDAANAADLSGTYDVVMSADANTVIAKVADGKLYAPSDVNADGTVKDGAQPIKLTLRHGQTAVVKGLPNGASYTIVEDDPGKDFTVTHEVETAGTKASSSTAALADGEADGGSSTLDAPASSEAAGAIPVEPDETPASDGAVIGGPSGSASSDASSLVAVAGGRGSAEAERTVAGVISTQGYQPGTVAVRVTYTNAQSFTPAVPVEPQASKTLEGRDLATDDSFTFKVSRATGAPADEPLPRSTKDVTVTYDRDDAPTAAYVTLTGKTAADGASTGAFSLGAITFDRPGTYVYDIIEVDADPVPGIAYSQALYRVTYEVTPERDADGKATGGLAVATSMRQVSDDLGATNSPAVDVEGGVAAFTNRYSTDAAHVSLSAKKYLFDEGANQSVTPADNAFSFELRPKGGTVDEGADKGAQIDAAAVPMPEGSEGTGRDRVFTSTNQGTSIVLGTIAFNQSDEGRTYIYVATEKAPREGEPGYVPGTTYDTAEHEISVTVTENAQGFIVVTVTYPDEPTEGPAGQKTVQFENRFAPTAATATIRGTKTLVGRDMLTADRDGVQEEFGFGLSADEATSQAIQAGVVTIDGGPDATVSGGMDGAAVPFAFGDMTFTRAGTYTFYVKEGVPPLVNTNGLTYDQHRWTVTVKVANEKDADGNLTGKLAADVSYARDGGNPEGWQASDGAAFLNTYAAKGSYALEGVKAIAGRPFATGDSFTFRIEATGDNAADAPMPAGPGVSGDGTARTVTIAPTGGTSVEVSFGTFSFTKEGAWDYVLSESDYAPQGGGPVQGRRDLPPASHGDGREA